VSLGLRTILGFVALLLVVGTALFVPAATLTYWQGWLYVVTFFGSAAAISLYLWRADPKLLERRVQRGPLAEGEASQRLIQSVAGLAFIALLVVPSVDHRFGWSNVPWPLSILADVVVVVGFWIVFVVFRVNTFTAATIGVAAEQRVIETGPYGLVRHPMYAGAMLLLLATPVALGSWWDLLACVPMLAVIILRLQDEERFLLEHLPGYMQYRARVRFRLVPGVW
jgi:protein-S-isoprenylcysteine O-methyltransferase Ste14